MQLTGSQIVLECLKEQGVDTIFGYPGGTILNIYDELYKQYAAAEAELQALEKSIQSREMRQRQIAEFIAAVEDLPETVSEFQSDLWATLVDHVTVYSKKDIRFTLANGAEVNAE